MVDWRPDVLGAGFECTDIDLGEDSEGPVCATLVRSLPPRTGFWGRFLGRKAAGDLSDCDVLYVHGWSDYFFQKRVANFFTDRGARFFALDLRKYGRSLREWQTTGYIENLDEYDAEIEAALTIIQGTSPVEVPANEASGHSFNARIAQPRKLVLLGHSTGGLVLSLWADRHRGVADAVVLNSPWLELQLSGAARLVIAPVVNLHARLHPLDIALPQLDLGFYSRSQIECNTPDEFESVNALWRPNPAMAVRTGWLRAILAGHAKVASGLDVGAPACVLLSARSEFSLNWNDRMLRADTVLEVDAIAKAALKLGPSVTVERIDGALHDVFLSELSVREHAFGRMESWLKGWQASFK